MSVIILTVDEVMRTLSSDGQYPFVVNDKEVDIVRFALNTGFTDVVLDEYSALRVMYQRPGETEVRAQTLTYYDTDGLHNYYDWQLLQSDLTKDGSLMVALCILDISGGEVSEWHTTPCAVRVLSTIHTDDSDEGDETITPTVAERVAVLEASTQRLYSMAGGAPVVVPSVSEMVDEDKIYVLTTDKKWYYYDGSAWTAGGEYGAVSTDRTLSEGGMPADAEVVGARLTSVEDQISSVPVLATPEETEADFYVSDSEGYVIAEFVNGHIRTAEFDSAEVIRQEDVQSMKLKVHDAATLKGSDSDADLSIVDPSGYVLSEFEDGHIKTQLFDSRAVTPKILTVKKDGSGDFTSIRAAVESITDASSALKPYVIEVWPGTYNVFEDYTQAEIETAGEGSYIQDGSGFVGILLEDGVSMRGIGNRDEIILHGELDPSTYSAALRNNVATLNLRDTMSLENLTVSAKNIRYCVHDDFRPTLKYVTRYVKNCVFKGDSLTSGSSVSTWGEGSRQGKTSILEDCDFTTHFLWHSDNQASATRPVSLIVKNCRAVTASISCNNHAVLNNVHLYNDEFAFLSLNFTNVSSTNKMMTVDGNISGAMIKAPSDWNYLSGDVCRFRNDGSTTLTVGQLVSPSSAPYYAPSALIPVTDPSVAYGVVVGVESDWIYVQESGYIQAERLGFSSVSVGDKITSDSNGMLELNGGGDIFGTVTCVTSGYGAFIKMRR